MPTVSDRIRGKSVARQLRNNADFPAIYGHLHVLYTSVVDIGTPHCSSPMCVLCQTEPVISSVRRLEIRFKQAHTNTH